jgi:carboxysome peptide B
MVILQVEGSLTCTSRVEGLKHSVFRIVRDTAGKRQVASDPVGCKPGDWVFLSTGTAARFGCGDPETLTDLSILGIIDQWPPLEEAGAKAS